MNTLLITTQVVAYGAGIVSASLNIAAFMRRRRAARRRRLAAQVRAALHSVKVGPGAFLPPMPGSDRLAGP